MRALTERRQGALPWGGGRGIVMFEATRYHFQRGGCFEQGRWETDYAR